jgi:phage baseplate assembly protein W
VPAPQLLDLFTDDDGDLQVGGNGDLLVARDADVVAQEMTWRLKTTQGDWMLIPSCGADLEQLIGEPNAPKTGALMEALISRALTYDGFLRGEIREIRAVPVNRETLVGLVTITYGEETFTKTVTLDLKQGILG